MADMADMASMESSYEAGLAGPRQATYAASISGGIATLGFVWVGDPDAGREHARSLGVLGAPVERRVIEQTYVDLQRVGDTPQGHALRRYWKGHYLPALPEAAIEALLAHDPSMGASLQTHGGAIADVPAEATAVHGLTYERLKKEPVFSQIYTDLLEFIGEIGRAHV